MSTLTRNRQDIPAGAEPLYVPGTYGQRSLAASRDLETCTLYLYHRQTERHNPVPLHELYPQLSQVKSLLVTQGRARNRQDWEPVARQALELLVRIRSVAPGRDPLDVLMELVGLPEPPPVGQ